MPRPCKRRRVCALPACRRFGSLEGTGAPQPLEMTVDEFESIRLLDWVGLTQEEAAARMGVARATVQGIYTSARKSWRAAWWRAGSCASRAASMSFAPVRGRDGAVPPAPGVRNKERCA